jgi:hypothetical protein
MLLAAGLALGSILLLKSDPSTGTVRAQEKAGKTPVKPQAKAWTLAEAMTRLKLNPRDPYLQYVALQLARQENQLDKYSNDIEWRVIRPNRRGDIDLFNIFTGALAVQESLQLDTMRPPGNGAKTDAPDTVKVSTLTGPGVKSHPWKKMLAGKNPELSVMANYVPHDQYYALFGSLNKMIDALDSGDLWSTHLFDQALRSARTYNIGDRLKEQLAVETNPLMRPFYDLVVEEVVVTGSDLYLREGSDVSMVFRYKKSLLFETRMNGFLAAFEQKNDKVKRSTGKVFGVNYVHLATSDRAVHVFSAYPKMGVHVRSNSKAGLERVIATILGQRIDGQPLTSLSQLDEFKYIRTLMEYGADEEDGFVYLSDAFIRRQVGPQVKLTELHRMRCYNHLRMIGHASLFHRTQVGRKPDSLIDLAQSDSAQGLFGRGSLACPDGGTYTFSDDKLTAICSKHGHVHSLTPCREIELTSVTESEAREYKSFVTNYNRYWRQFFDPIAIRLRVRPDQFRVETIILPLIDNTIYRSLSQTLGGEPEHLDALPIPAGNIFTVNLRVDRQKLAPQLGLLGGGLFTELNRDAGETFDTKPLASAVGEFTKKGVGNQVGFHVFDSNPTFDLNFTSMMGELTSGFSGGSVSNNDMWIGFLIASLNQPVYISTPLKDTTVTDNFLDELDKALGIIGRRPQRVGWFRLSPDFYRVEREGKPTIRAQTIRLGPVKWRIFWARIGEGLYIASQQSVLEDIEVATALAAKNPSKTKGPKAHAMVRVRAENWKEVFSHFQLGWAENNREACLRNHDAIHGVSRALLRSHTGDKTDLLQIAKNANTSAERLFGYRAFCPDGGHYHLTADGKLVRCTVHGTTYLSKQQLTPNTKAKLGKLSQELKQVTAELTFTKEGLHAVLTMDRKK